MESSGVVLALVLAGVILTPAGSTHTAFQQAPARTPADQRIRDDEVRSQALGRAMPYRVLLPRNYQSSGIRYPVLYLLHGLAGDQLSWTGRTKIADYAAALPLLIVMPAGENQWYTNAADGSGRFEDFLVNDLPADVAKKYRTVELRDSRAIAGASMGGFGALKIALKRPAMFGAAASFSGAFGAARDGALDRLIGGSEAGRLRRIFGPPGGPTRRENDLFAIASNVRSADTRLIYLRCGASDPLIDSNRELVGVLRKAGVTVDFHETPGAHNWDYWDRSVREFLPALMTAMKDAAGRH